MAGTLKVTKKYAVVDFEDGLSVVPKNWMTKDENVAFWPTYTSTARHAKAVKRMEEPESTWTKCTIKKIYGSYLTYDEAIDKLKKAEEESDLTSNTENEENRKKTRKYRAAKNLNTSFTSISSNDSELTDDISVLDIPKVPQISKKTTHMKNSETQKSFDDRYNDTRQKSQSAKKVENTAASNNHYNAGRKDFDSLCIGNDEQWRDHENNDNVLRSPSLTSNKGFDDRYNDTRQKSQSAKKVGNTAASNNHYNAGRTDFDSLCIGNDEPWRDHEDNDYVLRSPSLTSNKDSRNKNCLQDEEGCDNDNDNGEVPMSVVAKKTSKVPRANCNCERNSSDSMRYVIRKLTDMEMKINVMHKDIKIIGKRVEKDRTGTFETEEREKVDIFQDLPLKDENDLEAMETKLKNNLSYRNQMMTQLAFVLCANMKTSCLRLMKLMVSNELAIKYSWYGAKKKQIFSKLEICKVIISVIRKSFSEATDDKISAPIKIWLAHAKERITRNKEQEKENVPVNDVE